MIMLSLVTKRTMPYFLALAATSLFAADLNTGLVLDYNTNQPIEGAYVVTRWLGTRPISGQATCDHVEVALSDRDGKYELRTWRDPLHVIPSYAVVGDAYKPGYESLHSPVRYYQDQSGQWIVYDQRRLGEVIGTFASQAAAKAASGPSTMFLAKARQSSGERFQYVKSRVFGGMNCYNAGDSHRNLYVVLRTAYGEAKSLAVTSQERETLNFLREIAKASWLARPADATSMANLEVPPAIQQELE